MESWPCILFKLFILENTQTYREVSQNWEKALFTTAKMWKQPKCPLIDELVGQKVRIFL